TPPDRAPLPRCLPPRRSSDLFFAAGGGGRAARPRSRRERGQDALVRVTLDLGDVVFGAHRDIEVDTAVLCETCQGSCCQPGTSRSEEHTSELQSREKLVCRLP